MFPVAGSVATSPHNNGTPNICMLFAVFKNRILPAKCLKNYLCTTCILSTYCIFSPLDRTNSVSLYTTTCIAYL